MTSVLTQLQARGCIHDSSNFSELDRRLIEKPITLYCGFDPTADSLHVGHMLPLVLMRRFQQAGHKPIALIGAATGMIGDPSWKSEERKLLDHDTVATNIIGIEKQVQMFLSDKGKNAYELVRNDTWLNTLSMIDFLRDVGKHFSVNAMIAKDSVRSRLENREQGISYTEFSYVLLQSYDFYWLLKHHGCQLQVGGSDQWGNITAGLELIRRSGENLPSAYGLTFPLLTTSSGTKFGKTEKGAVWLDAKKTSPYQFYQYWLNSADNDILHFLRLFSGRSMEEISALEQLLREKPEERDAQKALASELTTLVHGKTETDKAQQASRVLFGGEMKHLDSSTLLEIFTEVPSTKLAAADIGSGMPLLDLLARCNAAASKSAARRLIESGGIYLNNERVADAALQITTSQFIEGKVLVIRSGRKNYYLAQIENE